MTLVSKRVKGTQCFHCHEWGHIAAGCPSKLMVVLAPLKRTNPFMVKGQIQETHYHDLIIDSGADMTVVHNEAVPEE